jgi:hypothetical protein
MSDVAMRHSGRQYGTVIATSALPSASSNNQKRTTRHNNNKETTHKGGYAMASRDLERVALTLVADGKGILAADETRSGLNRPSKVAAPTGKCFLRRLGRPSSSAASSCTTRPSGRRVLGACRSRRLSRFRAWSQASKSIPARSRSPAPRTRPSPRGLMVCGIACRNTDPWVPVSRNGGLSYVSPTRCRLRRA